MNSDVDSDLQDIIERIENLVIQKNELSASIKKVKDALGRCHDEHGYLVSCEGGSGSSASDKQNRSAEARQESIAERSIREQAERKKFIEDHSTLLLNNLRAGKISSDDVERAKRELGHQEFQSVKAGTIDKTRQIQDKIKAIELALEKYKSERPTKPINWNKVRSDPSGPSVRDDPLNPKYRILSPRKINQRPYAPSPKRRTSAEEYEREYEQRTGRKFDPLTS